MVCPDPHPPHQSCVIDTKLNLIECRPLCSHPYLAYELIVGSVWRNDCLYPLSIYGHILTKPLKILKSQENSKPCQTSKMELFAEIVDGFQS